MSHTHVTHTHITRHHTPNRTTTYFVTPSSVWPRSAEEKAAIVDGYKSRLSDLDCRLYDRGAGTCPFGTSCFYRHMNK